MFATKQIELSVKIDDKRAFLDTGKAIFGEH
jgi:hypothetical protein